MHLEVKCTRCQSRYRVKGEMAGRMVQCKRCGQRFLIPMRPAVVQLGEEDVVGVPSQEGAGAGGGDEASAARWEEGDTAGPSIWERPLAPMPHVVSDVWLPIAVLMLCYGVAGYQAVRYVLAGNGPTAGVILVIAVAGVYLSGVVRLVVRGLEGASKTFDFDLPNAVWLQTTAACGAPMMGAVLGLVHGRVHGMAVGAAIGSAFMVVLLTVFFQSPWPRALQAGVFGVILAVVGGAVGGAAVLGAGYVILPLWHMTLPWEEPKPVVAEAPKVEVAAAPTTVPVVTVTAPEAPKVEATTAPAPVVVVEELKWAPAVDGAGAASGSGGGVRWPADVQRLLPVSVGASVVRADGPGVPSCVAVIDEDSCDVYDLRTGKRVGTVGERFAALTARVSPDGGYLVAQRPAVTRAAVPQVAGGATVPGAVGGTGAQLPAAVGGVAGRNVVISPVTGMAEVPYLPASDGLEIWATGTGRLVGLVGAARVVGFAGEERLVTFADHGGDKQEVQVWDAPSGQVVRTFGARLGAVHAVSPGGRYLGTLGRDRLRVYDLETGTMTGEAAVPAGAAGMAYALAFSPDGTGIAGLAGETSDAVRLLVWDAKSGGLEQEVPVAPELGGAGVAWAPDGRGLVCGSDLIDRGTGKAYWKVEQPAAFGGMPGRARGMLADDRVLYEFAGPGGTKVLYKGVPVGAKRDVEAALRAVGGVAAAATSRPAVAGPGVAALAQVAGRREWTVSVTMVRRPNLAAMDRQIELEQARLRDLEQKAAQKRVYAKQVLAQGAGRMVVTRDVFGHTSRRSAPPTAAESAASTEADRAEEDRKKQNGTVLRMRRERQAAEGERTVLGRLEDGTAVEVEVEGAALAKAADGCEAGGGCVVAGVGRVVEGVVRVRARSVTPVGGAAANY